MVDLVNWTSVTTPTALMQVPNQVNHWFWGLIILMVFLVMVLVLLHWGLEIAVLSSCFPAIILSYVFYYAGLVNKLWVAGFIAILLLTMAMVFFTSTRENV